MAVTKGEKKHDQGETMRSVIVSSGNLKRLGMITHLLVVMLLAYRDQFSCRR